MLTQNKDITLLDSRLLNTFIVAANAKSFTAAAVRANMTQSGVSQQIAKLEEQIGIPLFNRIGKKVVLTNAGQVLKHYVIEQINITQQFVDAIRSNESHICGLVCYGMPPSCLLLPYFSMLLEQRKAHPNIELEIALKSNHDVERLLLNDRLDFTFVTNSSNHSLLDYTLFCQEEFALVSSNPNDFQQFCLETLDQYRFILYPEADYYYDRWLQHIFPQTKTINTQSLIFSGRINSIHGAIDMAISGLGLLVVPLHCIRTQLKNKQLFCQPVPLISNDIFLATVKGYQYPQRVKTVIEWFMNIYHSEQEQIEEIDPNIY